MKTKKKGKRSWKNEKSSTDSSSSDSDNNLDKSIEHDLTDYAGNSIKLMTEIFKILGDKKLKTMIPNILKPIDMNDLKACLVEESMALSKKRLVSILNGETYSSSSSDSEEEVLESTKKIANNDDIISLDGISDDSDIFYFDELPEAEVLTEIKKENTGKKSTKKHKKGHKQEKILEKKKSTVDKPLSVAEEKAMTALELLELQARARAIKSQLALESVTSPIDNVDEEIKGETSELKEENELKEQPKTRKVKLRRDHLRIDPNRTNNNKSVLKTPKSPPPIIQPELPEPVEEVTSIETTEIKKERRSSTDSLIVESPSHPLIVISSDDEGKGVEKSKEILKVLEITEFTEIENNLVNELPAEPSSSEEGEISSEDENKTKSLEKTINKSSEKSKNESKNDDQDFIIIDCEEPDLESDSEDLSLTKNDENMGNDNTTWKTRWLDSKKVKTVLRTSKLCNNMKRKFSLKRDQQSASPKTPPVFEQSESVDSTPQEEEGSIEQFNTLSSDKNIDKIVKTVTNKTELEATSIDYFEIVSDSDENK